MFISFLYPFPLRGRRAAFLWVAYKQMGDMGRDGVAFIASEDYFLDPEQYRRAGRFECHCPVNPELAFRVPMSEEASAFRRSSVPESIYGRLKDRFVSDMLVWRHLITEVDEELVTALGDRMTELQRVEPCDGILTWCNYASLNQAAQRLKLPVFHCELGPLRNPWYLPLGYLDFAGVNGGTECESRFCQSPALPPVFGSIAEMRAFFSADPLPAERPAPDAELGIPLQVEDDSNVLAYGRGFDMHLLMQYAQERFRQEAILVRPHPGGHTLPKTGIRIDSSKTSSAFVARCAQVLTLNSSVAVEAMLQERPVTILGESPARHLAGQTIDTARTASLGELEFLLLNYFIPYELLFDAPYMRWRLSRPSESAIRARHWSTLRATRIP